MIAVVIFAKFIFEYIKNKMANPNYGAKNGIAHSVAVRLQYGLPA